MSIINCLICGKEKYFKSSDIKNGGCKFCSLKCYWISKKGKSSWNKGIKQLQTTGEKHFAWKGDKASYSAIHYWIYSKKGKPQICEHCGVAFDKKKLYWANKNHTYKRDENDYFSLCASCHMKFDMTEEWRKKCGLTNKGKIPWNKGTKGLIKPNSGSFKKGEHRPPNTEFKKKHT